MGGGVNPVKVMPDHLHRAELAFGTVQVEDGTDENLAMERAWLASSLRCYLENDLLEAPKDYSVNTISQPRWWLNCCILR